ncbi:MAG: hypothetical protein ABIL16_06880 [candidate division WOR-3 bacterium]
MDENTLPIHLEHRFVGTSSNERDKNISLLADMLRVKKGDFVFFYIEGSITKKGRFFGIFRAVDNEVYHLTGNDARQPGLPKKLIYRKKIEPYEVYPKGVLEWIALDKLPTYAKEILWTLIYRKMRGKRGNTMLFPWEVDKLISLIRDENNGLCLLGQNFTFDRSKYKITSGTQTYNHNIGKPIQISLKDINSETAFQAYILQNLSIGNNKFLPEIFGNNIVWIGNEVFAGSGMQKIDILTIEKTDETKYFFRIVELKYPKSGTGVNFAPMQLEYYINWAREDIGGHLIGAKKFNIKPILFCLTHRFNSIPSEVIKQIQTLSNISNSPEIWEMDYDGKINKVL